ncbi:centlein-like isoform X3 [Halichondria panicea]|uniref:centlein-like isoform X3 n=1 Tax=Halichondria panicea TaxID=6063 RepID=UPI00312B3855
MDCEDVQALKLDHHRLCEELAHCKADKEFVWSLWKQLQKESPDLTAAVDMVTTREKLKREQEGKEIVLLMSGKDEEISSLRKSIEDSVQKETHVSSQLQAAESKYVSALEEVKSLQAAVQQQLASNREMMAVNVALRKKCSTLEKSEQDADCLHNTEEKLSGEDSMLAKRVRAVEAELAESEQRVATLSSALSVNENRYKHVQNELSKTNNINREQKEKLKLSQKELQKLRSTHREEEKSQRKSEVCDDKVVVMLERTEVELFEAKSQLKVKAEELQCLRCSHDKRLERMKWLKTNYNLAVEQIKTYETKSSPRDVRRTERRRRHSESALKHEDSRLVWNELTQYKSLCQQMEHDLVLLEEERDVLLTKCSRNQTTIFELRACLQHEKDDLERKVAAIAMLEGSVESFTLQEQQVDELQHCVDCLETEKKQLLTKNIVLEKQCAVFYQERIALESTIIQMQHELSRKNIKGLCKATMTEAALHSPSTDCNQSPTKYQPSSKTKLSFPTPQSKVIQPSHSQSKPLLNTSSPTRSRPMHQKKLSSHHQRSHSDGDTLPQQHKQPQWIAKDSERSTNSTTPYVLTVTTPHQTASGRTQKERRGVCRDVQTSSTQTRDLGPHKCAAQSKVKRLEQRLQSVLNKLADESLARTSLIQSLREQTSMRERCKEEIREMGQKIQGYRVSLKVAESERNEGKLSIKKLEDKVRLLESSSTMSMGQVEGHIKSLEKEKKELQDKHSELRSSSQFLQQALQSKDYAIAQAKKTQEKTDRDLRQKRQLIEDHQRKLKLAQSSNTAKEDKIGSLTQELDKVTKLVSQDKQKMQLLRAQLSQQALDKDKLVSLLERCQEELDGSIQQMVTSRDQGERKLKAANECLRSAQRDLDVAREKVVTVKCELQATKEVVNEFKLAIQMLADELEAKYSKQKEAASELHVPMLGSGPSARVRQIAQAALRLSDEDIDDLFCDTLHTHSQKPNLDGNGKTSLFLSILQATADFKPPFTRELTSQIMTKLC